MAARASVPTCKRGPRLQQRENGPPQEEGLPDRARTGSCAEHSGLGHGIPGARQVEASGGAPKRHTHKVLAVTALFFPRTLDGRIVFVCVIVSMVTPALGGIGVLVIPVLLCMAIWAASNRRRHLVSLTGQAVAWIIGFNLSIYTINLVTHILALLASNGAKSTPILTDFSYGTRLAGLLMAATIWLLMGVPYEAYSMGLDKKGQGSAQTLLVKLLTATACIFTGIYIWLLHYTVLREISTDQLAAGVIFTVVLLTPYYKSLARGCWRRGVPGFLKITEEIERPWSDTVNELLAVRQKNYEAQTARTSEPGLAAVVGHFVSRNWRQWLISIAIFIAIITVGAILVALVSRTSPPTSP